MGRYLDLINRATGERTLETPNYSNRACEKSEICEKRESAVELSSLSSLAEAQTSSGNAEGWLSPDEWKAEQINRVFDEHRARAGWPPIPAGQRFTAEIVRHGRLGKH